MKIVEERVRGALILSSALVLAALLAGRYIMGPAAAYLHGSVKDLILGAGLVAIGAQLFNAGQAVYFNVRSRRKIARSFPQSLEDVRRIGVQTPVDFAFMMGAELVYMHYSPFTPLPTVLLWARPKFLKQGRRMFAEMFGRDPLAVSTGDWDDIAHQEVAAFLHREGEDIPQDEFKACVSERVKRYYHNLDRMEREAAEAGE